MKKAYYDLCYVNVEEAKASETETKNKKEGQCQIY